MRSSGLEVSDRIVVWLSASGELADALGKHADEIAREVLATELTQSAPSATDELSTGSDEELGLSYWLTKA